MNAEPLSSYAKIILAVNRTLIGQVNPSLRAIMLDLNEAQDDCTLYFYHDGPLTKSIEAHYQLIAKNTLQDFFLIGEAIKFNFQIIRLDFPALRPIKHTRGLYARIEPFMDPVE